MAVLFIVIIMGMRVIQSVYSKRTAILMPSGLKSYIHYIALNNTLAAAFAAVTLVCTKNFSGCNATSILIAACSGTFLAIGSFCGIKSLNGGTMVLNSIFATAGLILPCIIGIFAFNEPLSLIQIICIGAVLVSAVLLISSSKKISGGFSLKTFIYLVLSFISNGMVMFCQKLFGMIMPDGNVALFSLLTFLIPAIALFVAVAFIPSEKAEPRKLPNKLIVCAVFQAFAVFVIQQLVTMLTPVMHSAVLFTLVNGSATIITAIVGALMYREKITVKSACGIIIGIGALILINAF